MNNVEASTFAKMMDPDSLCNAGVGYPKNTSNDIDIVQLSYVTVAMNIYITLGSASCYVLLSVNSPGVGEYPPPPILHPYTE